MRTGFYRPNLTLLTTPVEAGDRDQALQTRLAERPAGPTIVYVTLQRTAERVAEALGKVGFDAKPYHAGLKADERGAIQDWLFRLLLLSAGGETPRVAERTPQEELHLGVDAPQVVRGPPPEGVEDLGVQAQEKGLPFAHV